MNAGRKRQERGNVENADLSDEAPADVSNDCGLMAKSEGVQELSPGDRRILNAGLSVIMDIGRGEGAKRRKDCSLGR